MHSSLCIMHCLHGVHKGALYLVEYNDTHAEQNHHKTETIPQHPPFVATYTEHSILEELDNTR